MGVPSGKYHRRLGIPSVDDLGGTGKGGKIIVGILLRRRYRGEESLDELVIRSGGRLPYADDGAFLVKDVRLLVGPRGGRCSSAGGPNGGNHQHAAWLTKKWR